jgi:hypothetical protein
VLLPSVLPLQEHIAHHAADTIPTHRATRALVAVIERSVTAASGQTASGPKMKIGSIGAGHIGGTIGELWAKAGHPCSSLHVIRRK